jgi:Carboxypeptidase regulatory-like domain
MPDSSRALRISISLCRCLSSLLSCLLLVGTVSAFAAPAANDLKVLISFDQPAVTAPFPARITLHLHNAGQAPLWIYAPVRDISLVSGAVNPFTTEDLGEGSTTGGSSLEIHLVPADGSTPEEPAAGRVMETAGFPHPKLVAIAPGDDYEEKAFLQLSPASAVHGDARQPLWGAYRLSVTYRARYSNGPNLNAILETHIWEGEAESNRVELELRPPAEDAHATVGGSVVNAGGQPLFGIVVTLSDQQEQPVSQSMSDQDGKFNFAHLPFGFYWVTARRRVSPEDATVLRHVTPTPGGPEEEVQLVQLQPEVHHPSQLLHKPVLFRVFDSQDKPAGGVALDDTWSTGTVSDQVKGQTNEDGSAALELIPGRNFVTLARKGCAKQDERVDVAPGVGIDGFKLAFDCNKR